MIQKELNSGQVKRLVRKELKELKESVKYINNNYDLLKKSHEGCNTMYNRLFNFKIYKVIIDFIQTKIVINKSKKTKIEMKLLKRTLLLFLIVYLTGSDLNIILQMRKYHLIKLLNLQNSNDALDIKPVNWNCFIEDDKTMLNFQYHNYYKINLNCLLLYDIYNNDNKKNRFQEFYSDLLIVMYILSGEYIDEKKLTDFVFSTLSNNSFPLKKSNVIKDLNVIIKEFNNFKNYDLRSKEIKDLLYWKIKLNDFLHNSI